MMHSSTVNHSIIAGTLLYNNSKEEVWRCLDGVQRQSRVDWLSALTIRDNGDGSCLAFVEEWVKQNSPAFEVFTDSGKNIGFGRGHNFLANKYMKEHFGYLLFNPDGLLHPLCFEKLITFALEHECKGLFESQQFPIPHPKVSDVETGITPWSSACCVLIPNEVYHKLKGFSDDFFMYCEDVDLSWRARAHGYSCYLVREALINHYVHDREFNFTRECSIWKSAYILAHKWRNEAFKEKAVKALKSIGANVQAAEIADWLADIEPYSENTINGVSPEFSKELYFAECSWYEEL